MRFVKTIIPCRTDNYAVVLHDAQSGSALCVDAPDAGPIIAHLEAHDLNLTHLLITHHHGDHVAGIDDLKTRFSCQVVAPQKEREKISNATRYVGETDEIEFEREAIAVVETPGHTAGHVSYYMADSKIVFTGDTLFVMGCGRLLECGAEVMWNSLQKLKRLPEDTSVFCGHEYAKSNAAFAKAAMPQALSIQARAGVIDALRRMNRPVMPSTIGEEMVTNPFLLAKDVAEFSSLRARKDSF